MKVELKIEPQLEEPYAEIHAPELTPQIEDAAKLLGAGGARPLAGTKDKRIYVLEPKSVVCFFSDGAAVHARTAGGVYTLRLRLFELEERFAASGFVRVSNSAIVNAAQIASIELHFNGTLCIRLKDGTEEYASRRYVSRIKAYLGL